jgi:hypothetical protein
MNKKGDATDPLIILIILAFLSISFIIGIFVNTKIGTIISGTVLNQSEAYDSINTSLNSFNINSIQVAFVTMFGMMVIFTLVSSFLICVHPAFMFLYIITLGVTIFAAIFVGNFYAELQENAILGAVMATQPKINFIMGNIVKIIMAVGGLSMVIVFSKIFSAPTGQGDVI